MKGEEKDREVTPSWMHLRLRNTVVDIVRLNSGSPLNVNHRLFTSDQIQSACRLRHTLRPSNSKSSSRRHLTDNCKYLAPAGSGDGLPIDMSSSSGNKTVGKQIKNWSEQVAAVWRRADRCVDSGCFLGRAFSYWDLSCQIVKRKQFACGGGGVRVVWVRNLSFRFSLVDRVAGRLVLWTQAKIHNVSQNRF